MQTKSYRALKWTLFMGLAGSLASACVVSSGDGDDDDFTIDGGDNGTGNTGNKAGTGGKGGGGSGGTSGAGTAGTGTAGTSVGGEGGTPAVEDPDYPGACDSELKTPSVEGSCAANANDNDCGACLKQKCCATFGACYGKAPTSACGYGPSPENDLGQFDQMLACYEENNDGIKSVSEILLDCDPESFNQCADTDMFLNEDTNDLLDCAQNGADMNPGTSDDCLDVCFPPAE